MERYGYVGPRAIPAATLKDANHTALLATAWGPYPTATVVNADSGKTVSLWRKGVKVEKL